MPLKCPAVVKRLWKTPFTGFLTALLIIAALYTFLPYNRLTLQSAGHWQLDLVEFEDRALTQEWGEVIAEEGDPFVSELFGDKDKLIEDLSYLYSYSDLAPYVFYKVFGLRGVTLVITHKIFLSLLGCATVLFVFLLVHRLLGPSTGFLAACIFLFSPHVWLAYNFDGGVMRPYNLTFSILAALSYVLAFQTKRRRFIWLSAGAMALSFLYFHMGSFAIPAALFIFACHRKAVKDGGGQALRLFFQVLGIAAGAAIILHALHSLYFHLPFESPLQWFKAYFSKGAVASHSASGIVLFSASRLGHNLKEVFNGLFWSGRTDGWHFTMAPPGVPYLYTRLFLFFFIAGLVRLFRQRKESSSLVLWWMLFFLAVYSFVIVYRQKNVLWLLPALAAITAAGVQSIAKVFQWWSRDEFPAKKAVAFASAFLFLAAAIAGSRLIFHKLPKDNFYDGGAYMGHLRLHEKILKEGAHEDSLVLFTLPQMQVGARMVRLFLENKAPVAFLSQQGVIFPPVLEEWRAFETEQLDKGKSLYYCFLYFDNRMGNIYVTDNAFREVFTRLHPDSEPFIILGLDGKPLWHLYVVRAPEAQAQWEKKARETEEDASMTDLLVAKTFKVLAGGFLMVTDFEALKKKGTKKIKKMSDAKWEKRSLKVKGILMDLPEDIRRKYGFKEEMTREDVLKNIQAFDKKKARALIAAVPDDLIARKFREYRNTSSRKVEGEGALEQTKNIWQRALGKWNKEK